MDGFTCFMSGFAEGVDQFFVEMVMEKQKDDPSLELIAVIPYQKRLDSLRAKGRTYEMLEACCDTGGIPAQRLLPPQPLYGGAL